jgi:hypothetical protein
MHRRLCLGTALLTGYVSGRFGLARPYRRARPFRRVSPPRFKDCRAPAPPPARPPIGRVLNASYEIDFWGKNRAAEFTSIASRFDREVIVLSTVASGITSQYRDRSC